MPRIYLDHNATSPLLPTAHEAMTRVLAQGAGNASSLHTPGRAARLVIESARQEVARLIGALPEEIVLTSGGTESNNLAIFGAAAAAAGRPVVTSDIEHPSVLGPMQELERRGMEVRRVRPTRDGVVPAGDVLRAAGEGAALVSLMLANNEVGTLQPVAEVGAELRRRGILFHCDAAQAAGKVPVDVRGLGVDLLSIAGHKFGGPQGVGALYVRRGLELHPHLRGGGQELNRRPGTENVAAIAGLGAAAAETATSVGESARRQSGLRDFLEEEISRRLPGSAVNGRAVTRIPNTSSLAIRGVTGESLVVALDLEGVAISAGSACSAGTIRKSHVLEAMGLREEARESIRVSLGPGTTRDELVTFLEALQRVVARARAAPAEVGARRGA
ncbi:MAG TPA: cysteine desulfurase family protein [Candidatus Polarisedimenticolia bacterium]|nr:cysteine desulfurase family protein [Candidatus Polarisedimenticolia bacterium]